MNKYVFMRLGDRGIIPQVYILDKLTMLALLEEYELEEKDTNIC